MSGNVFTGSPQSRRATDGRSISQENSGLNGDELVSSLVSSQLKFCDVVGPMRIYK